MKNTAIFSLIILIFSACATQQKTITPTETIKPVGLTEPQKRAYWQQYVHYVMDIDMDTDKHRFTGKQKLVYVNNSPDTLHKVFYHLYWNAFQPGSAMDWHARTLPDPDRNMDKTIQALKPDETGWVKIKTLLQDGQKLTYQVNETILEVELAKPLLPGASTVFDMTFQTQVPKIIRRAGRNNTEGIDYSMAQWYPKMCEYDNRGWHNDPYLGREFYGVWGDFDVSIRIDKKYTVAATGVLQNPENIPESKGFATKKQRKIPEGDKLTWNYTAKNVHDFSWAADPDYVHDSLKVNDDLTLHFYYQNDEKIIENWKKIQPVAAKTMEFYNEFVGKYPYKQYSIIQAGDGGMEYAQLTFVNGNKSFESLRGTVQHEMGHAWFQFALATNESEFPWMDEGFTSFIQDMANVAVNGVQSPNPFAGSYDSYYYLVKEQKDEPLSTHSDHFLTNMAYWVNAYDKGKLVLSQLSYIVGFDNLRKIIKEYYKNWAMKHPQPDDFFRIAEKVSGMNLKWFQNEWVETIHHIDYKVDSLQSINEKTKVILKNNNEMPMPLDVFVIYKDGSKESYYIPLDLMCGEKNNPFPEIPRKILPDWRYGVPQYEFVIDKPKEQIKVLIIDPLGISADINLENNAYVHPEKDK
jgi:hypothetical protein